MKGSQVLKIEKNPDLHRATKVSSPKTPFFSEQQKFPVQKRHFSPSDKSFLSQNAVFNEFHTWKCRGRKEGRHIM
jgi:hypothetical protein